MMKATQIWVCLRVTPFGNPVERTLIFRSWRWWGLSEGEQKQRGNLLKRHLRQSLTNDCDQSYFKEKGGYSSFASFLRNNPLVTHFGEKSLCFTQQSPQLHRNPPPPNVFLFIFQKRVYTRICPPAKETLHRYKKKENYSSKERKTGKRREKKDGDDTRGRYREKLRLPSLDWNLSIFFTASMKFSSSFPNLHPRETEPKKYFCQRPRGHGGGAKMGTVFLEKGGGTNDRRKSRKILPLQSSFYLYIH